MGDLEDPDLSPRAPDGVGKVFLLGGFAASGVLRRIRAAGAERTTRNVLPDRYPLTGVTIGEILAAENVIGRPIDYGVLLPRAQALYEFAAEDLNEPRTPGLHLLRQPGLRLGPTRIALSG
jgi:hypothetical protein